MTDTIQLDVEYTDTFAGEANYSWVKRASVALPCNASNRTMARRAKAAMGLSGARGRGYHTGDTYEFRPYGYCMVMFATVRQ
jgi:hypothetical protein